MSVLRFERNNGEEWSTVVELGPGDRYGSISDQHNDGSRDVYSFGVDPVDNVGEVKRSKGGVDIEVVGDRLIHSEGLESVARLNPGENYEMEIKSPRSPAAMLIRFTYTED